MIRSAMRFNMNRPSSTRCTLVIAKADSLLRATACSILVDAVGLIASRAPLSGGLNVVHFLIWRVDQRRGVSYGRRGLANKSGSSAPKSHAEIRAGQPVGASRQ